MRTASGPYPNVPGGRGGAPPFDIGLGMDDEGHCVLRVNGVERAVLHRALDTLVLS